MEREFLTLDRNTRLHEIFYGMSNMENICGEVRKIVEWQKY